MVLCGAQPVLYTYPAWTFAGKHDREYGEDEQSSAMHGSFGVALLTCRPPLFPVPPGPGAGSIGAKSTLGANGSLFGPPRSGPQRAGERSPEG